MNVKKPIPKIQARKLNLQRIQLAEKEGLHPVIAKILAARPYDAQYSPEAWLNLDLADLDLPEGLADLPKALERLVKAFENKEVIGLETDHDCDGQTSHAVLYEALITYYGYPKEKIRSYIGHRLKEGYGLSSALVTRILSDEPRPTLIITADNGSTDEASIHQLKTQGIDVIVTDHHEIPPEGVPKSAVAVLNPTRPDCNYPDRSIAGCMVAWLLMAALRQALIQSGLRKTLPKLGGLLDFVAVGTIADCVSIARSKNNRIVVNRGMSLIEKAKRPCWQVLLSTLSLPIHSEDLGFKIAPLLNSDGRLACAFGSVSFLLSESVLEARKWVAHLTEQNKERKLIQRRITDLALEAASKQYQAGKKSLCILLNDGHAGVHGISASRIKDLFGRPTLIFCPKQEDPNLITGSARSIPGIHLKHTLQTVNDAHPGLIQKFGGHEGAAGLILTRDVFQHFSEVFESVVQAQYSEDLFGPVIWTDGILPVEYYNEPFLEALSDQLEPFGREFEPPQFEGKAEIASVEYMGAEKNHARLKFWMEGILREAVWFFCKEDEKAPEPVQPGEWVSVVYLPKIEVFQGNKRLICHIVYLDKC